MTISKQETVKFFQRLAQPDPGRDWRLMLSIFAVALVGTVVWNVLAFQEMMSEKDNSPSTMADKTALNTAAIDAVREIFRQRAVERAKYQTGEYSYNDPSQ